MQQLIELIIIFSLGWWIGSRITAVLHRAVFLSLLKELGVSDEQLRDLARRAGLEIPEESPAAGPDGATVIPVKLEQHSGQIYAFRKSDDKFLGQGPDTDSLIARLNETMTPCRVVVSKEDGADLLLKNNS